MIAIWWTHLSFSHAALAILLVLLIAGSLWLWRAARRRPQATPVRRHSWGIVDYSAQCQRQIEWLGPRYLLANPINRNHNTKTVLR